MARPLRLCFALLLAALTGACAHPLDPTAAYDVQARAVRLRVRAHDPIAGFKAAATSPAAMQAIESDEPVSGVLFASGRRIPDVRVPAIDGPRLVEAELGFVLGVPVRGLPPDDEASLRALVSDVRAVVELPAPSFESLRGVSAGDLIADNAGSDLYVVGPSLLDQDPNAVVAQLWRDGVELGRGRGTDAMGDQRRALRWLIGRALAGGYELEPGYLLITGALGPVQPGEPGRYEADYGVVRFAFTID